MKNLKRKIKNLTFKKEKNFFEKKKRVFF